MTYDSLNKEREREREREVRNLLDSSEAEAKTLE